MKITKIETKYALVNDDYIIYASVLDDGNITLTNEDDKEEFGFVGSDRETIKSMGELIVAASKIK